MSTAATADKFSGTPIGTEASHAGFVIHSYGETISSSESLQFKPLQKAPCGVAPKKPAVRVLRRFKGFLLEIQGADARVVFVENGEPISYDLPAEQLRLAGIVATIQPFQMDEVEMDAGSAGWIFGYRFLPLAKPSDAFIETLSLDEERRRKRALIQGIWPDQRI